MLTNEIFNASALFHGLALFVYLNQTYKLLQILRTSFQK